MKKLVFFFLSLVTSLTNAQSPLALTMEDFEIQAGETKTVYVSMQNEGYDVIAIEFKMDLPEGLVLKGMPTLTSARLGTYVDGFGETVPSGKTVYGNKNKAGYWIFSIFSMVDQSSFTGTEGPVIEMKIGAEESMSVGETAIRLYGIELSTKQAPYYPAEYSNKVTVVDYATAIAQVFRNSSRADVYTAAGVLVGRQMTEREVLSLPKGLYIANGQKVIRK